MVKCCGCGSLTLVALSVEHVDVHQVVEVADECPAV